MDSNKDFLGTGWSFPPTFTRVGETVKMVSDDLDIHESLYVLFSTSLGERLMVPQYGSGLSRFVFRSYNTTMANQMSAMVRQAILNFEPRIDVDLVQVKPDTTDPDLILIDVTYTIRKTNTRSNMVYPFYLTQATIPAQTP